MEPITTLRHNDRVTVNGVRWQAHTVSTLSGYGHQYRDYDGPGGMELYAERAERNRCSYPGGPPHNRHNGVVWLNAEPTVIAAVYIPQPKPIEVNVGETIYVDSATPGEGGYYRIEAPGPMGGDHCKILPTVKPEVPADLATTTA